MNRRTAALIAGVILFILLLFAVPAIAQDGSDFTTWNVSSIVPVTEEYIFIHRVDPISLSEAFVVYQIPKGMTTEYVYVSAHVRTGKACFNIVRDAGNGFGVPIRYEASCTIFNRMKRAYNLYNAKRLDRILES